MKKVKLTRGLHALVSDEDFERVSQFEWYASQESRGGRKWYAVRFDRTGRKTRKVRMSRFIMGLDHRHKRVVDHLDSDGLDNRRENLEICTQRENMKRAKGWKGSREKSN